ncbi:MAG: excinuclease ABC subunit UvrA [Anaerolineales bacterium]|nr:excinuclease ABC subunit UvrA [Chloroflexota bacterium]MBL6980017.1 excinuclease ABC subunit UvrA [Anaerolineales bacterium]
MNEILDYYRSHSPITDPGEFVYLYKDLPDGIHKLIDAIQGQLMHRLAAEQFGVTLTRESRGEQRLRTMQQRLARIAELSPDPLTIKREPKERQVGMCRDFAVFLVSMLRHKGIPARLRVGFADYLGKESIFKGDHWIAEYWNTYQYRWVLADPDVGGIPLGMLPIKDGCNFHDLRHNVDFYVAGSAWKLARDGKVRPDIFRYSGRWKGFPCIRGNLLHDFQALNLLELALFDYWDELHTKPENQLTVDDKTILDRIADMTLDPQANFEAMRQLFDDMPRTQRIYAKLRQLGVIDDKELASVEELKPSGMGRLTELSNSDLSSAARSAFDAQRFTQNDDDLPEDHPAYTQQTMLPPGLGDIIVRGARQHNLRNIDVHIPRHKLVVITGVSGSGKSSLAFDTIYAEGQRRYVESLSSFARQFMDQMEKPLVDQITGLSPAIAIEQKTIRRNPRSTVGTVTEILDYLRVLYARLGIPHCPQCGRAVQPQSTQQIANQLSKLPAETRFQLLAPIARKRKGAYINTFKKALRDGYSRARVDGKLIDLSEGIPKIDKNKKHNIELIVDRLVVPNTLIPSPSPTKRRESASPLPAGEGPGVRAVDEEPGVKAESDFPTRLIDSIETTLRAGEGILIVDLGDEEITLSEHNACPDCDISFPQLEPHIFSFNSPLGMCDECNGLGVKLQVDPDVIVVDPEVSILDGATSWYGNLNKKKGSPYRARHLKVMAEHYNADINLAWKDLPKQFQDVIMYGSGDTKFNFEYESQDGSWSGQSYRPAMGIIYHVKRLFRQTKSEGSRRYYMQFMSRLPCPRCEGERLNPEARFVTIDSKRLPELTSWSIEALHDWVGSLLHTLPNEQIQIGEELVKEIYERLGFLRNVGLHYLTLNRPAPTLSGGEGQRIRLASQIGSGLVGVMYILDEPSIGLHARDHRALLDTLIRLRDIGNTVLVVEHDEATMRAADWIIDLGPGPGMMGGEVVAAGSPDEIILDPESITGKYLSGKLTVSPPNGRERRTASASGVMTLRGAGLHNLKGIDVNFPLGTLITITGVSGSGKSSLIAQTMYPALARALHNAKMATPGPHEGIEGLDKLDKIINITQDPIGRNPRSNPGTYVGVLSEIRKVFAEVPDAKALGFKPGRFSFNVKGGRCEECKGYGFKKVEMHFLADVWVRCATCEGKRFNRQTLQVTYKERNIAEVLDMDVQEALTFFENHPKIRRILQTLHDVGLDYVKLGQSALTLSGGEAQRVKLAKELSRVATGRTVYILDEPTTGLHFADIQRLLDVLHRLVDAGNTVIIIEHNLDVIRTADWIIDLGPEGGDKGGYIIAEGTPEDVALIENSYTGRFLKELLTSR